MHTHRLIPLLAVLSCLCLLGCEKNSTSSGVNHHLTVTIQDEYSTGGSGWVALHSLAGDTTLAVSAFSGDSSIVSFPDLPSNRVSLTINCSVETISGTTLMLMRSYLDVPAGDWVFDTPDPETPLGEAEITVSYPTETPYYIISIQEGGSYSYYLDPEHDGSFTTTREPATLDNGAFSACAAVYNGAQGYCGWIRSQPFALGGSNEYTIAADHPLHPFMITVNPAVYKLMLRTYDGNSRYFGYVQSIAYRIDSPASEFEFSLCDIPSDRVSLTATKLQPNDGQLIYTRYSSEVPASLDVPERELSANCSADRQRFEGIAASGDVDMFTGSWLGLTSDSTHLLTWNVHVDGHRTLLSLPHLPDSLIPSTCEWTARTLSALENTPAANMDEIIFQQFKSGLPEHLRFETQCEYMMYAQPTNP